MVAYPICNFYLLENKAVNEKLVEDENEKLEKVKQDNRNISEMILSLKDKAEQVRIFFASRLYISVLIFVSLKKFKFVPGETENFIFFSIWVAKELLYLIA